MPKIVSTLLFLLALPQVRAQIEPHRIVNFTDDAGTGISTDAAYTHLLDFGSAGGEYLNPVINGVTFTSVTASEGEINGFGWEGFPQLAHPEGALSRLFSGSANGVAKLLADMNYGTPAGTLRLTGLTPGMTYEVKFFLRPWSGGDRWVKFVFMPDGEEHGAPRHTTDWVNLDRGFRDGYMSVRYVAGSAGVLAVRHTAFHPNSTFHCHGVSNERIDAALEIPATAATQNPDARTAPPGSELLWDNATKNNLWDFSSANWHLNGGKNGTAMFAPGVSARFSNIRFDGHIDADVTLNNVRVETPVNQYWYLDGAGTLLLNGRFSVADAANTYLNFLDARLSGPGSFNLESGVFRIANPANDFTGGAFITGGTLTVSASGALGSGAITMDSAGGALHIAAPFTGGALHLAGGVNKLTLEAFAAFAGLRQSNSGTLLATPGGHALSFQLPDGLLPPYVVCPANNGRYMVSSANSVAVPEKYPASVFTNATLDASRTVAAAHLGKITDLGGHTLTLGGAIAMDGAVTNGVLRLPADAYFYNTGNATIHATLEGPGRLVKFGAGNLTLTRFDGRSLVAHEGHVTLVLAADMDFPGQLEGAGLFVLRDHTLTFARPGETRLGRLHLHSGGLVLGAGVHVLHEGEFKNGPFARGDNDSPGATLTLRDGARWTQSGGKDFHFATTLPNPYFIAKNNHLLVTGAATTLDLNGGHFIFGAETDNRSRTGDNAVTITRGALLDNAAGVHIARVQGGKNNRFTVSAGGRVNTKSTGVGNGGGGNNNLLSITGAGTIWDTGGGSFTIGHTQGGNPAFGNLVVLADHAVVDNAGGLSIGHRLAGNGAAIHGNSLVISDNAVFHLASGNANIGSGPAVWDNSLVITRGGVLDMPGTNTTFSLSLGRVSDGRTSGNLLRVENSGRIERLLKLEFGLAARGNSANNTVEILDGGCVTLTPGKGGAITFARNFGNVSCTATNNHLRLASANPAQPAILDAAGAPVSFGIGRTPARPGGNDPRTDAYIPPDMVTHNTLRLEPGGVLKNAGAISVGSADENSRENALVLAGGEVHAASLAIAHGNRLEIVAGPAGVKPIVLDGPATFEQGSSIQAVCLDDSALGKFFPVIKAAEPIDISGVMRRGIQPGYTFRLQLSDDKTELSIGVFRVGQ